MNREVKEIIQKIEDVRDNPAILDDDGWCDNWMVMSAKECNILLDYLNQLEEDKIHLIEIISGLINYVKDTHDEDLTDKTAEVMEMVLCKEGGSNE